MMRVTKSSGRFVGRQVSSSGVCQPKLSAGPSARQESFKDSGCHKVAEPACPGNEVLVDGVCGHPLEGDRVRCPPGSTSELCQKYEPATCPANQHMVLGDVPPGLRSLRSFRRPGRLSRCTNAVDSAPAGRSRRRPRPVFHAPPHPVLRIAPPPRRAAPGPRRCGHPGASPSAEIRERRPRAAVPGEAQE